MHTNYKITWVILAGGQAKRMGGQDKGLILLNDSPLVEHVQKKLLLQHAAHVVINANRNQEKYQAYAEVFSDLQSDFLGPLAGIQAAIKTFSSDWFGFVPCDTPNLPNDLLKRMYVAIKPKSEILVAYDGKHIQPIICMIKNTVLPKLEDFLAQGERKLRLFYSTCHMQKIDFSHHPDAFINLNTPQELKAFERSFARSENR